MKMKSWAAEVIADNSGKFCGNGLRFASKEEAEVYVDDLAMRWLLVRETRVVESEDAVNYAMVKMGEDESSRYWKLEKVDES